VRQHLRWLIAAQAQLLVDWHERGDTAQFEEGKAEAFRQ
jgi:hypothetical protein